MQKSCLKHFLLTFNLIQVFNICCALVVLPVAMLDKELENIVKIAIFFSFCSMFLIFSMYLSVFLQHNKYEKCLDRASICLNGIKEIEPMVLTNFKHQSINLSLKLFRLILVCIIPLGMILFTMHGAYQIYTKNLKLIFPHNFLMIPVTNIFTFMIGFFYQAFVNLTFVFPIATASGVAVVVLVHVLAGFEVLKILIEKLNVESQNESKLWKQIILLHWNLIEQIRELSDAFSWTVFLLELICYFCFLNAWITQHYSRSSFIFFVYILSLANQYFFICLGNEKIQEKFVELFEKLYDTPWYEMKPKNRITLSLVLQMSQKPFGIGAGPFHQATFDTFLSTSKRWYSFIIVLNNIIH